jgi:hypothetical protein
MECADGTEPNLALCHPQTCKTILLEDEHQAIYRARVEQTRAWLAMPGIPTAQSAILERTLHQLSTQLGTEGDDRGS